MRAFWWLLGPVLLLAAPAAARPRDDALAGAFRCAVIGEARQWLDCYYGAAQPVRAGLGLAPALAAQVRLANAPPVGGVATEVATRDEVMARAAGCMRVAAERAWLDCYYDSATPMRTRLGLAVPTQVAPPPAPVMPAPVPPAPQIASVTPPPRPVPSGPPPMPRNTGLFNGMFNETRPILRNAPVKSYSIAKNGAFTMTLADGQVWMQSDEDQIYHPARWRQPAEEMRVTISPNAMHTFKLEVAGESKFYKVHRAH